MPAYDLYSHYIRNRLVVGGGSRSGAGYGGYGRYQHTLPIMPLVPGFPQLPQRAAPWDLTTPEMGYSYSPWYRALNLISIIGSAEPLRVKRVEEVAGYPKKTIDREHRAHYTLAVQGNREQSPMQVWAQMLWNAAENGVSYATIFDNQRTGKLEIIPFVPGDCWKIREDGELWYVVDFYGTRETDRMRKLKPFEVFELTLPQPNGIEPVCPWWAARMALYEGGQGAKVRSARASNNGKPKLALTTDQALNDTTVGRIQSEFAKIHAGYDENMIPVVLDRGMKTAPIQYAADQASETSLWRIPVSDVSNITGIPVSLLGDFDAGGYDSLEADVKKLYEFCIGPWQNAIADQAQAKLLTEQERIDGTHTVEHDTNLFRGVDAKSLVDIARGLSGGMPSAHVNEIRSRVFAWAPLTDKMANELVAPKNMGQDGSTNNMPSDGGKQGRPPKRVEDESPAPQSVATSDAGKSLLRATAKRCFARIANKAVASAKDVGAYLDFCASLESRYAESVFSELNAVYAVVEPGADVQSRVGGMVSLAARELNAVADQVTAKNQLVAEVEKCCRRLSRQWCKLAMGKEST